MSKSAIPTLRAGRLTLDEARELLALKSGRAHDSWSRIASRADVTPEYLGKLITIATMLTWGIPRQQIRMNLERPSVERVLAAARMRNAPR